MDVSISGSTKQRPLEAILRIWEYRELLKNLIVLDLKTQYRGSILGALWSLLNPVLLALVYVIAFNFVLRFNLANYPLWLLTGLLHWQFFSSATIESATILTTNANLIQNIYFPRIILPLAVVGSRGIHLMLAMVVYLVLFIPLGGQFWVGMLIYPLVLVLQTIFVVGVTLCVSILTLYFRDLQHLLTVGIQMLFWLTPVIYNFAQIPESAHLWFRINPMVSFVIPYQEIFYLNQIPSLANWGFMFVMALLALSLGGYLFWRLTPNIEDYL